MEKKKKWKRGKYKVQIIIPQIIWKQDKEKLKVYFLV